MMSSVRSLIGSHAPTVTSSKGNSRIYFQRKQLSNELFHQVVMWSLLTNENLVFQQYNHELLPEDVTMYLHKSYQINFHLQLCVMEAHFFHFYVMYTNVFTNQDHWWGEMDRHGQSVAMYDQQTPVYCFAALVIIGTKENDKHTTEWPRLIMRSIVHLRKSINVPLAAKGFDQSDFTEQWLFERESRVKIRYMCMREDIHLG